MLKLSTMQKTAILLKLKQILIVIKNDDSFDNIGLFAGESGKVLFLYEYYKVTKDKEIIAYMHKNLAKIFEEINKGNFDYSFGTGLAGVAWLIQFISKNKELNFDLNDSLILFDQLFPEIMLKKLRKNEFDFISGALGIGKYLLTRNKNKLIKKCLAKTFTILQTNKGDFASWVSKQDTKPIYNLGLSHGIPSILYYLIELQKLKLLPNNDLINSTCDFLISVKQNIKTYSYYYPFFIGLNNHQQHNSRLGWCYGDLGIGILMLNIANLLQSNKIKEEAISVLNNCAKVRNPKISKVVDAGFCHGSSGISYIFYKAYTITGNDLYKNACNYWLKETINFATFANNCAGYKAFDSTKNEWVFDLSLLEGISGIGLVLLSILNNNTAWDECFMLN